TYSENCKISPGRPDVVICRPGETGYSERRVLRRPDIVNAGSWGDQITILTCRVWADQITLVNATTTVNITQL
ncbi:unnamed protein product, partial [Staurois parvus]